jgi:hypothetical protein
MARAVQRQGDPSGSVRNSSSPRGATRRRGSRWEGSPRGPGARARARPSAAGSRGGPARYATRSEVSASIVIRAPEGAPSSTAPARSPRRDPVVDRPRERRSTRSIEGRPSRLRHPPRAAPRQVRAREGGAGSATSRASACGRGLAPRGGPPCHLRGDEEDDLPPGQDGSSPRGGAGPGRCSAKRTERGVEVPVREGGPRHRRARNGGGAEPARVPLGTHRLARASASADRSHPASRGRPLDDGEVASLAASHLEHRPADGGRLFRNAYSPARRGAAPARARDRA